MSDSITRAIALGNNSNGRDKLCRFLQYSVRALIDIVSRWGKAESRPLVQKLQGIEYQISSARKLLRLGKSVEMVYKAKMALHIPDILLQLCVTLSRICSACFLFLDNILWLIRVKVLDTDSKPISHLANRFWLLSVLLNLIRNAYDWYKCNKATFDRSSRGKSLSTSQVLMNNKPVLLDTVKNLCDILIPLNGLQYMRVSGLVQGVTGTLSSIISLATIWEPNLRLADY